MIDRDEGKVIDGWILDEKVGPKATLRQGDLILFYEESNEIRKTGIVVTADCDLEKKKHAKTITLVPVVTPATVLEYYLLPEDCEKKRHLIENYVFKMFLIDQKQDFELKTSALRDIISTTSPPLNSPEQVASTFLLNDSSYISIECYKILMGAVNSSQKNSNGFKNQIRTRGDLLVLPNTEGLGIKGSIAWVRHIWQVPISDVAIRTSEIPRCSGESIARLDSPYRYRLTQLMAQVFSDIGLPDAPNFIDQLVEKAYK